MPNGESPEPWPGTFGPEEGPLVPPEPYASPGVGSKVGDSSGDGELAAGLDGRGVEAADGRGDGRGVARGAGAEVGLGVGLGVGFGVGLGVGFGVG